MEPYVIGGLVIVITFLIGAGIFKRIYDNRTQEPDVGKIVTEKFGLELPDGVNLNDALGGVFKR